MKRIGPVKHALIKESPRRNQADIKTKKNFSVKARHQIFEEVMGHEIPMAIRHSKGVKYHKFSVFGNARNSRNHPASYNRFCYKCQRPVS